MVQVDQVRKILAAELRRKLSDTPKKPFMRFANYEFEGELKSAWDTISVPVSPKIVLNDVSGNGDPATIRANSLADITATDRAITKSDLVINKLHNYREKFSKLEEIQTLYSIKGNRLQDLVNGIETTVESSIITMIDAFFTSHSSQVITISTMSVDTVAAEIMKLRTALSKKEVPMDDRILVVSPDVSGFIATAKILSGTEDAAKAAIEGWQGRFAGFDIYESNLIQDGCIYAFRAKSYNYVRQLIVADVTKATDWVYFNLLWQVAHWGKVFDQNAEQLMKMVVSGLNPTPTETETETETETA